MKTVSCGSTFANALISRISVRPSAMLALLCCIPVATAQEPPPLLESNCPYIPEIPSFYNAGSPPKDAFGASSDLRFQVLGPLNTTKTSVYLIKAPDVSRSQRNYPEIAVRPGDNVQARACGCVQTGGSGKTWKRYDNPAGPNSDRMYHGLISIGPYHLISANPNSAKFPAPSTEFTTGNFLRIGSLASFVDNGGKLVASTTRSIELGYEDDDPGDNGYWGFDEGNDSQCRNEGVAVVEIRVQHTMGNLEFDINRNGSDISPVPAHATTAGECAVMCSLNPRCKSMTFVETSPSAGGACWLKNARPSPRSFDGMVSAVKL